MINEPDPRIIAERRPGDFIGRAAELDACTGTIGGLRLGAVPGVGASELLKQTYDHFFRSAGGVIPFYFSVRDDEDLRTAAKRFLYEFVLSVVAYGRSDANLLTASPGIRELAELALPADGHWIDRLVELYLRDGDAFSSDRADADVVRACLRAPVRARSNGADTLVMIDDLHRSTELTRELSFAYERSGVRFIFASRRRFEMPVESCRRMVLKPLEIEDAGEMIGVFARQYGVAINDSTRDLIATQFGGNAKNIEYMFASAREKKVAFDSFENVGKVYTHELLSGSIRRRYDQMLRSAAARSDASETKLTELLHDIYESATSSLPLDHWRKLWASRSDIGRVAGSLNVDEFIDLSSNRISPIDDDVVLRDHLRTRFRLEISGENHELVAAELLSHQLKRAPKLMARVYRAMSALGLREIMNAFRGQKIPAALIDYGKFKDEYKGAPDDEILRDVHGSGEKVELPKMVYAADAETMYRPIARVAQKELAAVAGGFRNGRFDDENEIVWLAAEIDSKLEATRELTEFWCDRLEMAALMCNFVSYKIWLVAPEGFSPDATEVLNDRDSYGSSRKQAELLKRELKLATRSGQRPTADEYEIVIPMSGESELISARAIEDIAKRHNFHPKAINQIKTAIVEACINAAEHSSSPDGRIYQKVLVEDDRIVITVSNRGINIRDKLAAAEQTLSGRRGWGLKLMETLMDEVTIDEIDDGTSISMTKYLVHETDLP